MTSKHITVPPGQKLDLDMSYDPAVFADRLLVFGGTGTLGCLTFAGQTIKSAELIRERFEELVKDYRCMPVAKHMVITLAPDESGVSVIIDFACSPATIS